MTIIIKHLHNYNTTAIINYGQRSFAKHESKVEVQIYHILNKRNTNYIVATNSTIIRTVNLILTSYWFINNWQLTN